MHEFIEHTADAGIRVRAADIDELFAEAARALFELLIVNLDDVQLKQEYCFNIPGWGLEDLLHDWLAELLFAFNARRLALADFRVQIGAEGLTATARGEPLDPQRHEIDQEIKAVTWHGLKVEECNGQWTAEVIVDI
jgi:SHS2 domain-containing protein